MHIQLPEMIQIQITFEHHNPMIYLKSESCAGRDNSDMKVTIVRELFGLTNGEDEQ